MKLSNFILTVSILLLFTITFILWQKAFNTMETATLEEEEKAITLDFDLAEEILLTTKCTWLAKKQTPRVVHNNDDTLYSVIGIDGNIFTFIYKNNLYKHEIELVHCGEKTIIFKYPIITK